MNCSAILSFGMTYINDYEDSEYLDSLIRAFKTKRADFIVLDSNMHGQKFLAACMAWAMGQNLLYNDSESVGGQETVWSFRLTETGKEQLGIIDDEDN